MLEISQSELEDKVMHYAKLLGTDHMVSNVCIDEQQDACATTFIIHNIYEENYLYFRKHDDHTIIHELLHLSFKGTATAIAQLENKTVENLFTVLHEQDIDMLAQYLAKALPKYKN